MRTIFIRQGKYPHNPLHRLIYAIGAVITSAVTSGWLRHSKTAQDIYNRLYFMGKRVLDLGADRFFKRTIHPGMTVIDIGSNIGYYAVLFSKLVGPEGRVYAFEPDPFNFEILSANVRRFRCENVKLYCKAVWSKSVDVMLHVSALNRADNRVYSFRKDADAPTIPAIAIDDIHDEIRQPVHFIKMDIQGSEVRALEGMQQLLKNATRLSMHAEFWPHGIYDGRTKPEEYFDFLLSSGFQVFIHEENEAMTPVTEIGALLSRCKGRRYVDLYCILERGSKPLTDTIGRLMTSPCDSLPLTK